MSPIKDLIEETRRLDALDTSDADEQLTNLAPALADALETLFCGVKDLAARFANKAEECRWLAGRASSHKAEHSRLTAKASTYEAEARNLRALID
jgi:hypothetical protein